VTETIEYEQFEHSGGDGSAATPTTTDVDLSRLSDIPMELSVEIGRTHMTVGETLDLRVGSVVALERLSGETADLLVNGTAIARGEVVVIDEQYGLRITEILDAQSDSQLTDSTAQPAGADPAEVGAGGDQGRADASGGDGPAADGGSQAGLADADVAGDAESSDGDGG
jgi:flagellar motor switch protein FliN